MIITVDGPDGVGKTTLAKKLAEALGCRYIDKPMYEYFKAMIPDGDWKGEADRAMAEAYSTENSHAYKAEFTCLPLLFLRETIDPNELVIIDRGIMSCYVFNGSEETNHIFDLLIEEGAGFDLCIFLHADKTTRKERMRARDANDSDLDNDEVMNLKSSKAFHYLKNSKIKFTVVNTNGRDAEEVFEMVKAELKKNPQFLESFQQHKAKRDEERISEIEELKVSINNNKDTGKED